MSSNELPKFSAFCVGTNEKLPGHLYFWTRETWSGDIPIEQQNLQLAFDDVCAVIRARFQKRSPEIFKQEFERLLNLAQAAFSDEHAQVAHAIQSLESYKSEIIRREGLEIKNEYLKELAKLACIASISILVLSFLIRMGVHFAEEYKFIVQEQTSQVLLSSAKWNSKFSVVHFGFLLASNMWGIWLSFFVRNMNLTFEQLQNPEPDLVHPWSRLLAFGLLAFILALFFQMQVLVITVGGVSTSQISDDIIVAIFVGLCLGFTDKALPNQVQQRIEEFFQNTKSGN